MRDADAKDQKGAIESFGERKRKIPYSVPIRSCRLFRNQYQQGFVVFLETNRAHHLQCIFNMMILRTQSPIPPLKKRRGQNALETKHKSQTTAEYGAMCPI